MHDRVSDTDFTCANAELCVGDFRLVCRLLISGISQYHSLALVCCANFVGMGRFGAQ